MSVFFLSCNTYDSTFKQIVTAAQLSYVPHYTLNDSEEDGDYSYLYWKLSLHKHNHKSSWK